MKPTRLQGLALCFASALAACLIAPSAAAQGNLIVNGSFESATVNPGGSFITLGTGDTSINGWIVGGDVDYIGTLWVASEGSRSMDLDGFGAGSMNQTFATTPGFTYTVTFDMAGNFVAAPTVKTMRVSAAGQSADFTFDSTGKTLSDMGWTSHSWNFVADDSTATLTFQSLVGTGYGPALDDVSVVGAVPEPGAVSLFASGGIALIGFTYGRRRPWIS